MERLSRKLGVEIFFKRDDLTGCELSGNKVRKLEYLLADAREKGADTVITCGGAQSNHCRATAVAAVKCGLGCTLMLRTEDPATPPPHEGNILLDKLTGARILWVSPVEYRDREKKFAIEAKRLREAGKTPYIIPEGGSNHIGSWGYVMAMQEIDADLKAQGITDFQNTTVLSATGSGGTTAGLILGAKMFNLGLTVQGVNVCDDEAYFMREIHKICRLFCKKYSPQISVSPADIKIVDGYVGKGYALSRREELQVIYDLARLEGVILDPVYTGKAFYGMISELAKDKNVFGERIVFVHTGGLFGLFPAASQFTPIF